MSNMAQRWASLAVLPLVFLFSLGSCLTAISLDRLTLFIHCHDFRETSGMFFIPELDVCALPLVQEPRERDLKIYFALITVLPIILSGHYGRLLDKRGRRYTMFIAATLSAIGDVLLWLLCKLEFLCPLFIFRADLSFVASTATLRYSWCIYVAAVLKGLGGGTLALNASHNAFIADTSSGSARLYLVGIAWAVSGLGGAVGSFLSGKVPNTWRPSPAPSKTLLQAAVWTWSLYLLYLVAIFPESLPPTPMKSGSPDSTNRKRHRRVSDAAPRRAERSNHIQMISEPLFLVFRHPILRWLAVVCLVAPSAYGALDPFSPCCGPIIKAGRMEVSVRSMSIIVAYTDFSCSLETGIFPVIATLVVVLFLPTTGASATQKHTRYKIGLFLECILSLATWRSKNWTGPRSCTFHA